jgi:hypothetical protein
MHKLRCIFGIRKGFRAASLPFFVAVCAQAHVTSAPEGEGRAPIAVRTKKEKGAPKRERQ